MITLVRKHKRLIKKNVIHKKVKPSSVINKYIYHLIRPRFLYSSALLCTNIFRNFYHGTVYENPTINYS